MDGRRTRKFHTYHDYSHTSPFRSIDTVFRVDTAGHLRRAVVVKIVVQLTVATAEFQLFQEERIVQECESVEDVEIELRPELAVLYHPRLVGICLTFFARMRASFINIFNLSFKSFSFSANAVSVA